MAYKLHYSDYATTTGPPDPAAWVGPPGPMGPPGPPGPTGPHGVNGIMGEPPTDGQVYGRGGGVPTWQPVLTAGAGASLPFLPLSGGSMGGHIYMSNHSLIDVAAINSQGAAPLPMANAIQTAGYQFWPPGGNITFSGSVPQSYINIGANYVGSLTGTSGIISAHQIVASRDTVAAPTNSSFAWLATYGNVGYPFSWAPTHAYALNAQVANGGRIYQVTTAGTSGSSGGPTGTSGGITDGSVVWSYVSPNNTGDRCGIYASLTAASTAGDVTAGKAAGPAFVAIGGNVQTNVSQGGTNLTTNAAGGSFAGNFLSNIGGSCTNFGYLCGVEISVEAATGSSLRNKVGLQVVQTVADAVNATNGIDVGIFLANQATQGTASGWMTGISFGASASGYFPMRAAGTMIGAGTQGGTQIATHGIDFSGVTFSGYSLRMPSFTVAGTGGVTTVGGGTQNALAITPGASSTADIQLSQSGTGQFQFNGNLITNGWVRAHPDASNIDVGTTNTLRLSGGTQPEIQVIGAQKLFFLASGGFQFNGNFGLGVVPIARQTITGSRGGNAALAVLLGAMAAYGFILDSTSA